MSDDPRQSASPAYATDRLQRALLGAARSEDPAVRARAAGKVRRWERVLAGTAAGRITVGSRVPVAGAPAWVTLEVVTGGFATGRHLADAPLSEEESRRVAALPADVPGDTDRARLNHWYLGDAGQAELLAALRTGHYRVDIPEEAALVVVALLLDKGFTEAALDLLDELRPFLDRLRFTPHFQPTAALSGTAVRLATVADVTRSLDAVVVPAQVALMNRTLGVWNPLYDRLVALWCRTVDGDLPTLDDEGALHGGRPGTRLPPDWAAERAAWLADFERARAEHGFTGKHAHRKGNFTRLHHALTACPADFTALTARDLGWVRRALAGTLTHHGAPGSAERAAVRADQAETARTPTTAAFARVLTHRLRHYPADGGIPALEPIAAEVSEADTEGIPPGSAMPPQLVRKTARALEAPPEELVAQGVITSADVLATVLPQLTSRLTAANFADPVAAGLHERLYTAFRRRRGLLLLNLEQQVHFEELPWVSALAVLRGSGTDTVAARRALEQATKLTLTAFPHAITPNPLVTELRALAAQAGLKPPLVQEVAADIFTGTFTPQWHAAALVASEFTAGTLYASYYDLPPVTRWSEPTRSRFTLRWGKKVAEDFTHLCEQRAREAGRSSYPSGNGTLLEQSQILTTHNLAALVHALDLGDWLREQAPDLAARAFGGAVRLLAQRPAHHHAELIQVKNAAYAWRQAIFFLGFCDPITQRSQVTALHGEVAEAGIGDRFAPVLEGLVHVLGGGRFTEAGTTPSGTGRRFLGWAAYRHWYIAGR
ncbi:hypothetical protein UO65_2321 [Actinokineospora spheciospongiae]|uniref:Uncharacterized protein n=1 Tax=Actinokineospora spheciospongiae TaxID=909613 RepID=W7J8I6_9PSEU|nr:hypothetical protein [Actinokineospora spheciospongiae]EWC62334.1 hypothetical protein UO65_2321 [Actinokineospora spheciospongiae]